MSSFIRGIDQYENTYCKELRSQLKALAIKTENLPRNLTPLRVKIFSCKDGYLVLRFPRQTLPDKIEKIEQSNLYVNDILYQYPFKAPDGTIHPYFPIYKIRGEGQLDVSLPMIVGERLDGNSTRQDVCLPDFVSLTIYANLTVKDPVVEAKKDIEAFLLARNLNINLTDPYISDYTPEIKERLLRLKNQFESLLESESREEEIQKFIDDHPTIFNPTFVKHIPKLSLDTVITDFVFLNYDRIYQFVELENSRHQIFTKHGDFTQKVNHGWQQLEDWDTVIEQRKKEIEDKYGIVGLENRTFTLIIGRNTGFTPANLEKIHTRNRRGNKFNIITFDDLTSSLEAQIRNLQINI